MKVIVRSIDDVLWLFDSKPFRGIKLTPQTRSYVTFLKDAPTNDMVRALGKVDTGKTIGRVAERAICSVLDLSGTSPDLMRVLDKAFGKEVTARNWNTVERVLRAAV